MCGSWWTCSAQKRGSRPSATASSESCGRERFSPGGGPLVDPVAKLFGQSRLLRRAAPGCPGRRRPRQPARIHGRSARSRSELDHGRVAAVDEPPHAVGRERELERALAVGGRLEIDVRLEHGAGVEPARGEPLELEGSTAAEDREDDVERRPGLAALGEPGCVGRLHLGRVADDGGPPLRCSVRRRRGPGWTKRTSPRRSSSLRSGVSSARSASVAGRHAGADEAVERRAGRERLQPARPRRRPARGCPRGRPPSSSSSSSSVGGHEITATSSSSRSRSASRASSGVPPRSTSQSPVASSSLPPRSRGRSRTRLQRPRSTPPATGAGGRRSRASDDYRSPARLVASPERERPLRRHRARPLPEPGAAAALRAGGAPARGAGGRSAVRQALHGA